MTRHRVPDAPAGRRSRHTSDRAPVEPVAAGTLDAPPLPDAAPAVFSVETHVRGYLPAGVEQELDEFEHEFAEADPDEDPVTAEQAVVVQDRPGRRRAPVKPGKSRKQLVITSLAAVCVVSVAVVAVRVTSSSVPVGVDDTGFGVVLAQPAPGSAEAPHSLVDNIGTGPAPQNAAQAPANGTGTTPAPGAAGVLAPLTQGVAAIFGGSDSPWVQPIPAGAAIDPKSSSIVSGMSHSDFHISHKQWTVPVYYADSSTPRTDVSLTAGWMTEKTLKNVPVPSNAKPDPSEDAHLTIIDRSKGCVYDFWGASGSGSGISAQMGNAMPTDTDGAYPGGLGSRASGFSGAAGLITPDDLRRGSIDHALVFAFPNTGAGFVYPATKSDGGQNGGGGLPEGGRVRLDPSIDLGSLGLNKYELMIAKAMQKYGMILGDTSGGFTVYSQNPQSLPAGTYNGLLPDETFIDLSRIPTEKLQVLKLGTVKSGQSDTVPNRCNGF